MIIRVTKDFVRITKSFVSMRHYIVAMTQEISRVRGNFEIILGRG